MTTRAPDAWQFVVLALAAYRVYRLVARDTITEPLRAAASYPDAAKVTLDEAPDQIEVVGDREFPKTWRIYAATLIRCPWCLGFYVSVAVWAAFVLEPRWTVFLATPWAIAAAVALAAKTLDR